MKKVVYLRPEMEPGPPLDRDALVDIYLELRPRLERAIARRVGSTATAADLAQEMFLRIASLKTPLHSAADAERFFMRIAVNASLDHLKVEARRRDILHGSATVFDVPTLTPEQTTLDRDEMRRLNHSLADLPEKCRDVLVLSRVEGLRHAAIAERLGVSVSLVEKYIFRALAHCRRVLEAGRENS